MKKLSLFLIVALLLPFVLVGCGTEDRLNFYHIVANYDENSQILNCSQSVSYVNNSDNALQEVCFFLYANSFDEGQDAVSTAYKTNAYPNGESYGNITFNSIKVCEKDANFSFENENSILNVSLENQLFPDEEIEIEMDYVVNLANINHRLGYGNNAVNFGNFFPIACVYEDGFVKNRFSQSGDPFYSDVSNFEVEINFLSEYKLASTGEQISSSNENLMTKTVCKAEKVRDFCFVLSKNFEVETTYVDDVQINYFYYQDDKAKEHLQTSALAVQTFEKLFGEYPYKQLSVVKTNFCFGGMEYPNLVMISDDVDEDMYDYVIVHEIAHQWWYGVVGNNEFKEGWVDEGLTEFSTALFYANNQQYGVKYQNVMENAKESYLKFVEVYTKINGDVDESMDRALNEFNTEPEYVNCTYTKGMLLFDSLKSTMSERKFMKCLREYYKEYSFKNSSAEKLIKSFSKSTGINLEPYFQSWIKGEVVLG